MKQISKGQQVSVSAVFKRRGKVATFTNPPTWIVYNADNKMLLQGVAIEEGAKWTAQFTVATSYVVPNGKEELTVEFSGYDSGNHSHVRSVDVELIDDANDFKPSGVVYSLINASALRDTIQVDYEELEAINWKIVSPFEDVVARGSISGPLPFDSATANGYVYKLNLGRPSITQFYNDPYLLVIDAVTGEEDADPITEIHPLYLLNARTSTLANQLTQFLDKARLIEIDPSLQWTLQDYLHFTLEGIKHINSAPAEPTYWTVQDFPSMLRQYLFAASALYALNARYMAEGFNSFEFSGLNTNLNFDRRETITYKIEELKAYLETGLAAAKKTAVSANGPGTPVGGETDTRLSRIGTLGIQSSPVSNRINRASYRRFR